MVAGKKKYLCHSTVHVQKVSPNNNIMVMEPIRSVPNRLLQLMLNMGGNSQGDVYSMVAAAVKG